MTKTHYNTIKETAGNRYLEMIISSRAGIMHNKDSNIILKIAVTPYFNKFIHNSAA